MRAGQGFLESKGEKRGHTYFSDDHLMEVGECEKEKRKKERTIA